MTRNTVSLCPPCKRRMRMLNVETTEQVDGKTVMIAKDGYRVEQPIQRTVPVVPTEDSELAYSIEGDQISATGPVIGDKVVHGFRWTATRRATSKP